MKFKKLGNTSLSVSSICLGTMTWGTQNSEKDAFEQMDYSVDQGINFFDKAVREGQFESVMHMKHNSFELSSNCICDLVKLGEVFELKYLS